MGADPQPYRFAGEPYETNSGFYYHRARWMDPTAGIFLGMDPFSGFSSDPPSLHRYLYAAADPVNKQDPTGELTIAQASLTVAIIGIVASISLATYSTYWFFAYKRKDAFLEPPDKMIFGYQISGSIGELILRNAGNVFTFWLGAGLLYTSGNLGAEFLASPGAGEVWAYWFWGYSVGLPVPQTGGQVTGYVGFAYDVEEPERHVGPFYCKTASASAAPVAAVGSVCFSPTENGRPGAYSFTYGIADARSSGLSVQTGRNRYYYTGRSHRRSPRLRDPLEDSS